MQESTEVLVIGAGPAGLAAAIAARRKGFDVIVADGAKPPIDKACGEGLMPNTLLALSELGVSIHPFDGRAFRGIRFLDGRDSAKASFHGLSGVGVRRTVLHQKMVARAEECGVSLLWNTPVTGLTKEGAILGGQAMTAKWIIGADGIQSRVRRWSGLNRNTQQELRFAQRRHYRVKPWTDCMEIYWGQKMQAYITPLGEEEICLALISREPQKSFEEAWRQYPELATRLRNSKAIDAERGAVTAMRTLDRVYKGNIALIGDASGSVDAITGEGLGLSFRQAVALADALEAGQLERYQAAHRHFAMRPMFMGHLLLLLDHCSLIRKRVLRALAKDHELFARLLALHIGKTSAIHSVTTSLRLGWQFLAA
jgi:flavin-dependent dehydrogenase